MATPSGASQCHAAALKVTGLPFWQAKDTTPIPTHPDLPALLANKQTLDTTKPYIVSVNHALKEVSQQPSTMTAVATFTAQMPASKQFK